VEEFSPGQEAAMRMIEGEQVLMRIFIDQTAKWERRPLYTALLELFRRHRLAGATVLQGIAGFGPDSILHEVHLLRLSQDLPVVIEVVDTQEHLDAVLPEVDRMMNGGLITMEKVRVVRYENGAPDR
jgi:PII-like signaling protein